MSPVVLSPAVAAAVIIRVKRLEATVDDLRTRLAERDALLSRALQELAVFRLEGDPDWFIYQRTHRHSTRGRSLDKPTGPGKPSPTPEREELA